METESAEILRKLRLQIAEMVFRSGEGHIPSSYSVVDIIYSTYKFFEQDLGNESTSGRFVLSKGHAAASLYAVLVQFGIMDQYLLDEYGISGGRLGGHPDRNKQKGVEANTGSLGHGLAYCVGLAMAGQILGKREFYVCLVGDGECQEGSTWEAASIAANNRLRNLIVVVDWNKSASQLQPIENLKEKWESFGFQVIQASGHDVEEMLGAFNFALSNSERVDHPWVIIAETIKGKGVDFIEGHGKWHHRIPSLEEMNEIRVQLSGKK